LLSSYACAYQSDMRPHLHSKNASYLVYRYVFLQSRWIYTCVLLLAILKILQLWLIVYIQKVKFNGQVSFKTSPGVLWVLACFKQRHQQFKLAGGLGGSLHLLLRFTALIDTPTNPPAIPMLSPVVPTSMAPTPTPATSWQDSHSLMVVHT
jgi:hypothetical protein